MTVNRLLLPTVLAVSSLSWAQAPWPVERQNRYGTGTAIIGPPTSVLTSPWISNRLAPGAPVSHGPSLGEGGIGYFGNWSANKVFKFDYRTGAILSAFQADNFVVSVPAIGPGNSLVVSTDNSSAKVFGIDTSIMDYQWFQTTGYVGGSPNIGPEGDTVYGTTGGFVHRKNAVTGATIWSKTGYGAVHGSCVFLRDDSAVVVPNGSSVSCLRWSDGKPIWSVNLGSSMNKAGVAPTGAIVVGSDSGTIYALDPGTGAILWTWVTLDKVSGGPAFSPDGSVVYMPSVDRRIYALRVSDGARLWSFTTSHWCEHAPTVGVDGRIYVHNKAGDLYCISPEGTQIWQVRLNGEARGPLTIGPDGTLYVGYTGQSMGLAMVRQQAISLPPESFAFDRGVNLSGGLTDVLSSDNMYLGLQAGNTITAAESPVRMLFTIHSPYTPVSEIKISVETGNRVTGLACVTELWNVVTSRWEQIDVREVPASDTAYSLNVSNSQRFAAGDGLIKARIGFTAVGSVMQLRWTARLDYLHFDVVPQFVP